VVGTNGGHVLAVDISSQMLVIAKERTLSLGLQDMIEFRESDIESLELPSSSFDAILCRWGLMFLPKLESALNHIFGALIDGGKFAAAVWSITSKVSFRRLSNEYCNAATGNSSTYFKSSRAIFSCR
jgi:ubiquinone/menaquinone biosynthesis C-methylase UbiE